MAVKQIKFNSFASNTISLFDGCKGFPATKDIIQNFTGKVPKQG
jgi:hypothetical protein